jgi:hypothetical protein
MARLAFTQQAFFTRLRAFNTNSISPQVVFITPEACQIITRVTSISTTEPIYQIKSFNTDLTSRINTNIAFMLAISKTIRQKGDKNQSQSFHFVGQ